MSEHTCVPSWRRLFSGRYARCTAAKTSAKSSARSSKATGGTSDEPCSEPDLLQGIGGIYDDQEPYEADALTLDARVGLFVANIGCQFDHEKDRSESTGQGILSWRAQHDASPIRESVARRATSHTNSTDITQALPSLTTDRGSRATQSSESNDGDIRAESNDCGPMNSTIPFAGVEDYGSSRPLDHETTPHEVDRYQQEPGDSHPDIDGNVDHCDREHGLNVEDDSHSAQATESTDGSDSDDTESFWESDFSDSTQDMVRRQLELYSHRISILEQLLREFWRHLKTYLRGTQDGNATAPASGSTSSRQSQGADAGNRGSKKRKQADGDHEDTNGIAESCLIKSRKAEIGTSRRLLLACPFCKKDPLRYKRCYRNKLSRIRDVKQHLSRHHSLPIYCSICSDTFENENDRDDHVRSRSCMEQPKRIWEGVTHAQKMELKKRASPKMSEAEQWFTIYEILFPGEPRPRSAYIDSALSEEINAFHDFAMESGPVIIHNGLVRAGFVFDNQGNEQGLSELRQTIIADGIQTIFERWQEFGESVGHDHVGNNATRTPEAEKESHDSGFSSQKSAENAFANEEISHDQATNIEPPAVPPESNRLPNDDNDNGTHNFSESHWAMALQYSQHPQRESHNVDVEAPTLHRALGFMPMVPEPDHPSFEMEQLFEWSRYLEDDTATLRTISGECN